MIAAAAFTGAEPSTLVTVGSYKLSATFLTDIGAVANLLGHVLFVLTPAYF